MPTYEYKCKACGYVFEEFQKISDSPLCVCPKCGGELKRVIYGGSGVIFKGSGWYVTDYGKGKSSATIGSKPEKTIETGETKPEDKNSKTIEEKAKTEGK
ncbi:zinc ribbon domain-containing protein [bacterium]|nr:zinc ribbon domain-containing protein [bacterium]